MKPGQYHWHLIPAIDASSSSCWLLLDRQLPPGLGAALDKICSPFFRYDDDARLWLIEHRVIKATKEGLERRYRTIDWCRKCLRGEACAVWNTDRLLQEGYTPRGPTRRAKVYSWASNEKRNSAELLGLSWPTTEPQIQAAFRKLALTQHPDQGGTETAMKRLIAARATLLQALAENRFNSLYGT